MLPPLGLLGNRDVSARPTWRSVLTRCSGEAAVVLLAVLCCFFLPLGRAQTYEQVDFSQSITASSTCGTGNATNPDALCGEAVCRQQCLGGAEYLDLLQLSGLGSTESALQVSRRPGSLLPSVGIDSAEITSTIPLGTADFTDGFTVTAWIHLNSSVTPDGDTVWQSTSPVTSDLRIGAAPANTPDIASLQYMFSADDDPSQYVALSTQLNATQLNDGWVFVAVVHDSATSLVSLYVGNKLQDSDSGTLTNASYYFPLIADTQFGMGGSAVAIISSLQDVLLFTFPLSVSNISTLASGAVSLSGATVEAQCLCKHPLLFNPTDQQCANDSSPVPRFANTSHGIGFVTDGLDSTSWYSAPGDELVNVTLYFQSPYKTINVSVEFAPNATPAAVEILVANGSLSTWTPVATFADNCGVRFSGSGIDCQEILMTASNRAMISSRQISVMESRQLRIALSTFGSNCTSYGISEIAVSGSVAQTVATKVITASSTTGSVLQSTVTSVPVLTSTSPTSYTTPLLSATPPSVTNTSNSTDQSSATIVQPPTTVTVPQVTETSSLPAETTRAVYNISNATSSSAVYSTEPAATSLDSETSIPITELNETYTSATVVTTRITSSMETIPSTQSPLLTTPTVASSETSNETLTEPVSTEARTIAASTSPTTAAAATTLTTMQSTNAMQPTTASASSSSTANVPSVTTAPTNIPYDNGTTIPQYDSTSEMNSTSETQPTTTPAATSFASSATSSLTTIASTVTVVATSLDSTTVLNDNGTDENATGTVTEPPMETITIPSTNSTNATMATMAYSTSVAENTTVATTVEPSTEQLTTLAQHTTTYAMPSSTTAVETATTSTPLTEDTNATTIPPTQDSNVTTLAPTPDATATSPTPDSNFTSTDNVTEGTEATSPTSSSYVISTAISTAQITTGPMTVTPDPLLNTTLEPTTSDTGNISLTEPMTAVENVTDSTGTIIPTTKAAPTTEAVFTTVTTDFPATSENVTDMQPSYNQSTAAASTTVAVVTTLPTTAAATTFTDINVTEPTTFSTSDDQNLTVSPTVTSFPVTTEDTNVTDALPTNITEPSGNTTEPTANTTSPEGTVSSSAAAGTTLPTMVSSSSSEITALTTPPPTASTTESILLPDHIVNVTYCERNCTGVDNTSSSTVILDLSNVALGDLVYTSITYSTVAGNDDGTFQVNSQTGVITCLGNIDRESNNSITLVVQALWTNDDQTFYMQQIIVDITICDIDEFPIVFANVSQFEVGSNALLDTTIGHLNATDEDATSDVVYSATGQQNCTYFMLDPNGAIILVESLSNVTVSVTCLLGVRAYDSNNQATSYQSSYVRVNITPVDPNPRAPFFNENSYAVTVNETTPIGTTVLTVMASDPDSGVNGEVVYSLVSTGGTGTNAVFTVDPVTGELILAAPLDYESGQQQYNLTIQATDQAEPPFWQKHSTAFITVDVGNDNDNPVELVVPSVVTLPANTTANTTVLRLTATDADGNVNFRYTLEPVNASSTEPHPFSIRANTGQITTITDLLSYQAENFTFIVFATEAEPPHDEAHATLEIVILPVPPSASTSTAILQATTVLPTQATTVAVPPAISTTTTTTTTTTTAELTVLFTTAVEPTSAFSATSTSTAVVPIASTVEDVSTTSTPFIEPVATSAITTSTPGVPEVSPTLVISAVTSTTSLVTGSISTSTISTVSSSPLEQTPLFTTTVEVTSTVTSSTVSPTTVETSTFVEPSSTVLPSEVTSSTSRQVEESVSTEAASDLTTVFSVPSAVTSSEEQTVSSTSLVEASTTSSSLPATPIVSTEFLTTSTPASSSQATTTADITSIFEAVSSIISETSVEETSFVEPQPTTSILSTSESETESPSSRVTSFETAIEFQTSTETQEVPGSTTFIAVSPSQSEVEPTEPFLTSELTSSASTVSESSEILEEPSSAVVYSTTIAISTSPTPVVSESLAASSSEPATSQVSSVEVPSIEQSPAITTSILTPAIDFTTEILETTVELVTSLISEVPASSSELLPFSSEVATQLSTEIVGKTSAEFVSVEPSESFIASSSVEVSASSTSIALESSIISSSEAFVTSQFTSLVEESSPILSSVVSEISSLVQVSSSELLSTLSADVLSTQISQSIPSSSLLEEPSSAVGTSSLLLSPSSSESVFESTVEVETSLSSIQLSTSAVQPTSVIGEEETSVFSVFLSTFTTEFSAPISTAVFLESTVREESSVASTVQESSPIAAVTSLFSSEGVEQSSQVFPGSSAEFTVGVPSISSIEGSVSNELSTSVLTSLFESSTSIEINTLAPSSVESTIFSQVTSLTVSSSEVVAISTEVLSTSEVFSTSSEAFVSSQTSLAQSSVVYLASSTSLSSIQPSTVAIPSSVLQSAQPSVTSISSELVGEESSTVLPITSSLFITSVAITSSAVQTSVVPTEVTTTALPATVTPTPTVPQTVRVQANVSVDWTLTGTGYLLPSPCTTQDSATSRPNATVQCFGHFINKLPGSTGAISATAGSRTDSAAYTSDLSPASSLVATLLNDRVWHDGRTVYATVQVRDAMNGTITKSTTVTMQITLVPATGVPSVRDTCSTSSTDGTCLLSAMLPLQAFSANGSSAMASFYIGDGSSSSKSVTTLSDTIHIMPSPQQYAIDNNILVQLVTREVYAGEEFTVQIWGRTGYDISTFQLQLILGAELTLVRFNVDPDRWVPAADGTSLNAYKTPSYITRVARTDKTNLEHLANATVRVVLSLPLSVRQLSISCQVVELVNTVGYTYASLASPLMALVADRQGYQQTSGYVWVSRPRTVALTVSQNVTDIVNTAVLDGQPVSILLALKSWKDDGSAGTVVTTTHNCSVTPAGVLQLSSACNVAYVNGSETVDTSTATVQLCYEGLCIGTQLRIWRPNWTAIQLDDPLLNAIHDWRSLNCTQLYQQTAVHVSVTFSYGYLENFTADLTHLLASRLTSSDLSVARVTAQGRIQGIGPGTAWLSLSNSRTLHASVSVTTSTQMVDCIGLSVLTFTELQVMTSGAGPPYSAQSSQTARATTSQLLDYESKAADVQVSAVFSDGAHSLLDMYDSLDYYLNATDSRTVRTDGSRTNVRAGYVSGSGDLLRASAWSRCDAQRRVIATGYGYVSVDLPAPHTVTVTGYQTIMTLPGDLASMPQSGALATSSPLLVKLVFPGGHQQDYTTDSRTVYSVSGVQLLRHSSGVSVIANRTGLARVNVSFTSTNLTMSISINVVVYSTLRLTSHPYPTSTAAPQDTETVLSPLSTTGQWQRASLRALLVLSDSSTIDVTNDRLTGFNAYYDESATMAASASSVGISSTGIIQATGKYTGNVSLVGKFSTGYNMPPLKMSIHPVPIEVTSLKQVVASKPLFSGERGMAWQYISVDAELGDGITYPSVFNGILALPQLLKISSTDTHAILVDQLTGRLTLNGNAPEPVKVTVSPASGSSMAPPQTVTITCNLQPGHGDADIGDSSGVAVKPVRVGSHFTVPVRVNTAGEGVDAVNLDITYDSNALSINSVVSGAGWNGGQFLVNLNDPPGVATIGGLPLKPQGAGLEIAVLNFTALQAGMTPISGLSNTLSSSNLALDVTNTQFIAGNVSMIVTDGSRRRRSNHRQSSSQDATLTNMHTTSGYQHHRHRRSMACTTRPPCAVCPSGRQAGDTNGDCVFDLKDASYLQRYVLVNRTGFSTDLGKMIANETQPFQIAEMDPDLDGHIDTTDASTLARIDFRLLRFVSNLNVTVLPSYQGPTATNYSCEIVVQTQLSSGKTATGAVTTDDTYLFVDFAHSNPRFQQVFNSINFSSPVVVQDKGSSLYGGIVEASDKGNGVFEVRGAISELNFTGIGISLFQVTINARNESSASRQENFLGYTAPNTARAYPYNANFTVSPSSLKNAVQHTVIIEGGYDPLQVYSRPINCILPTPAPTTAAVTSRVTTLPTITPTTSREQTTTPILTSPSTSPTNAPTTALTSAATLPETTNPTTSPMTTPTTAPATTARTLITTPTTISSTPVGTAPSTPPATTHTTGAPSTAPTTIPTTPTSIPTTASTTTASTTTPTTTPSTTPSTAPTTAQPITAQPTTAQPTTAQPTTAQPTTAQPTTAQP
eukprot:scpid1439/ scgid6043/ Protocadherin Fat 4; FAT tumor suppressor homolog 4; Fat-like cadherin protein FAT-J